MANALWLCYTHKKKIGICKYGRKTVIKIDLTFLHVLFTLPIVYQYAQTRDF